jgi:hypothetical protein
VVLAFVFIWNALRRSLGGIPALLAAAAVTGLLFWLGERNRRKKGA